MAVPSGRPDIPVAGPDVAKVFVVVAGHEPALLEPDPTQLSRAVLLRPIPWEFEAQLKCA